MDAVSFVVTGAVVSIENATGALVPALPAASVCGGGGAVGPARQRGAGVAVKVPLEHGALRVRAAAPVRARFTVPSPVEHVPVTSACPRRG